MSQEDNEITWFDAFSKSMNIVFTEEDFNHHLTWVKEELEEYKEFLVDGAKILDLGCGPGCTAVALSHLGYDVTTIDIDPKVMEAAQKNADNFGKKIQIVPCDILDMSDKFQENSFDACYSGGVLEHFPEDEISQIIKAQLGLAPVVIATVPIVEENPMEFYKDFEKKIAKDGIYKNLWTSDYWVKNILIDFNLVKKTTKISDKGRNTLLFVLKR